MYEKNDSCTFLAGTNYINLCPGKEISDFCAW